LKPHDDDPDGICPMTAATARAADDRKLIVARIERVTRAESVLRAMVYTHAAMALGAAVCILVGGAVRLQSPAFAVISQVPGWPWSWALFLAVASAVAGVGRVGRWYRLARAGLLGMAVWYLGFAYALAAAASNGAPFYAAPVYVGLAVLCGLHMAFLEDPL
jgi:hypothetical protein